MKPGRWHLLPAAPALLGAAWACLADAAPAAMPVDGIDRGWSVSALAAASRWHEHTPEGLQVRESGSLGGIGAGFSWGEAGGAAWHVQGRWLQGTRGYQGYSSVGQAVTTDARIEDLTLQLQRLAPLADGWHWGAGVRLQSLRRRLADAANARGYLESFTLPALEAGLQHRLAATGSVEWSAQGWVGAAPWSRMRLALPNADATSLRLGHGLRASLALLAAGGDARGWRWQAALMAERQHHAEGTAATVTRGGVPVGGASQPATTQTDASLSLTLRRSFE